MWWPDRQRWLIGVDLLRGVQSRQAKGRLAPTWTSLNLRIDCRIPSDHRIRLEHSHGEILQAEALPLSGHRLGRALDAEEGVLLGAEPVDEPAGGDVDVGVG